MTTFGFRRADALAFAGRVDFGILANVGSSTKASRASKRNPCRAGYFTSKCNPRDVAERRRRSTAGFWSVWKPAPKRVAEGPGPDSILWRFSPRQGETVCNGAGSLVAEQETCDYQNIDRFLANVATCTNEAKHVALGNRGYAKRPLASAKELPVVLVVRWTVVAVEGP